MYASGERVHCDACTEQLNERAEQQANDWWAYYDAMSEAEQDLFWDEMLVNYRLREQGRLDA